MKEQPTTESEAVALSVQPDPTFDTPVEKVEDEFRVLQIVDLNNVLLGTKGGHSFYATVKDSSKLSHGDKVKVKAKGTDADGVPQAAVVS